MGITTHVLDTARGKPAGGVAITLERKEGDSFRRLGAGDTDDDGRLKTLLGDHPLEAATYRITFETGAYFAKLGVDAFYPEVRVEFVVKDASAHHHVPLLLSPFGYSTYRGS